MKIVQLLEKKIAIEPIFCDNIKDDSVIVVFLHEALGSIGQWKNFPQRLCNELRLNGFVYEREGHGSSSPLRKERDKDYLHKYAFEELPELIDIILPTNKKIILVGHSDGGTIALLYAAKFPSRVKAVVSMAAHVIVEGVTLKGIQPAVDAYKIGKLDGLKKYHGEKTDTLFYAWANTWTSSAFFDWNICKDIESILCPVLALQGVKDQYGTEKQLDLIVDTIKTGRVNKVMINNCGHHPHLEKTDEVIDVIVDWLKTIFIVGY